MNPKPKARLSAYLHRRRLLGDLGRRKVAIEAIDRERTPLEFARACRDLGERYAELGDTGAAIRWFGHAIDGYLRAGLSGAAGMMCRKVIEFEPRVVRARATLAMLHLAAGREVDAIEEIRRYVEATRERGERYELTWHRLRVFAEVAQNVDVRTAIGDSLRELGAAGTELELLDGSPVPCPREPAISPEDRWAKLLSAVLDPAVPV